MPLKSFEMLFKEMMLMLLKSYFIVLKKFSKDNPELCSNQNDFVISRLAYLLVMIGQCILPVLAFCLINTC